VLARALRDRYPSAKVIALDLSLAMLKLAVTRGNLWGRLAERVRSSGVQRVCGNLQRLPLGTSSMDLVCSNCALEWTADLRPTFAEFYRVLARGGLLMFTTLGPDTLKELRAVLAQEPGSGLPHPLTDMHDIGDALVTAGFADPVMDMEYVTLTYASFPDLLRDLRQSGAQRWGASAQTGLRGRDWLARLAQRYESFRRDGRLPATFELVYGHAWKPEQPRIAEDGRAIIRVDRSRSKSGG
jgi:malonyl-CoA O-methyltransferase